MQIHDNDHEHKYVNSEKNYQFGQLGWGYNAFRAPFYAVRIGTTSKSPYRVVFQYPQDHWIQRGVERIYIPQVEVWHQLENVQEISNVSKEDPERVIYLLYFESYST